MGGIGKTTVTKVVFNQLCSHFGKCCSFLEGIREWSSKEGIVPLQKKLLSDIGGPRSVGDINDSEEGMRRIGKTLSNNRVLVVLDDVDKKVPIRNLIDNSKLHRGSRIIITTRDKDILQVEESEVKIEQYEMPLMDDGLALQLFCWHAFRKYYPLDDYHELSRKIVSLMGGLPLAIKVIGSLLKDKEDKKFWEETLVKLTKVLEKDILEKLRISYDDLDKYQKQIFLDIACFFFNEKKTDAIYMWESCKFYPIGGIEVLTKRCLIKILDNDKLWMHDQLIALGRHIVREGSQDDLGKQSRLWIEEEALQIIRTKERKHMIEALVAYGTITNEDFEGLPNLRFLELKRGTYAGNFARCHSNLKWFSWSCNSPLYWSYYPPFGQDFEVDNLYLNRLVVCKLCDIDLKDESKAWEFIKRAWDLKVLSLIECEGITTIPDISKCSALERLTLQRCSSLKRIESSIGNLQSLIELKIEACNYLTDLPKEIGALVKLKHFSLSRCSTLRELPGSIGNLTSLTELDLSDMIIRELPNSIGKINLEELDLSGHNEMIGEIPIRIGELSSLRILNLMGTHISGIPRTINMLHHLQTLNLKECHKIQGLPELPTSLTSLLLESNSLLSVPNLSNLTNLVELQLSKGYLMTNKSNLITGCNLRWIGRLSRLQKLDLILPNVPAPLELASLSHLEELTLSRLDLETLVQLPSCLRRLNLEFFSVRWAELLPSRLRLGDLSTLEFCDVEVEEIPLDGLPQLENLTVSRCELLQRLSLELRNLQQAHVSSCPELVEIQVLGLSKSMESFNVLNCTSLRRISGLSYLKNLEKLKISWCIVLSIVEGLHELESLKSLEVRRCPSLRRLIDASSTNIPDDCRVKIVECGDFNKDSTPSYPSGSSMKRYREEIFLDTSKFESKLDKISFTIRFHLGVKKSSEGFGFVGGINREKEDVTPDSVTYEGLVADVKNFGFRLKRMWYETPCVYRDLLIEIQSDEQVKGIIQLASKRELIHLYVEGGVDSEWKGEYDDEMMEMLTEEWRMKSDVYFDDDGTKWDISHPDEDLDSASIGESETHGTSLVDDFELAPGNAKCFEATTSVAEKDLDSVDKQDGAEFDISGSNEVRDSASVGESETDGTSSIDDFQSEPGNIECFEATGNRRQMRDGRIGRYDSVDGGKTASMENRKKDKDEIGEPANPSDVVGSSGQTCKGVEHYERYCKATTEVEDQRDFSSVKRDKTVETDQVLAKTGKGTGCSSKPERDPTERCRGKDIAKSSRNDKGLRLGRDATSTLGKGTESNSGRDIPSSSQSSATSSSGRARGSTSGKGTTLSSGKGVTLSLGMGRGSSSRMDTTKMGTASSPGRGITSSSQSSATLSTERGRDSTSGRGTTVSSGRGMTLSLGTGKGSSSRMDTTKMGTASSPGRGITSSSRSSATFSIGRGRGSTSGKGETVSSGRDETLSLGTGGGSSSRMDTNKMHTASSPRRGVISSPRSSVTLSAGGGRGSTSGKGTTVSSGRGATLSLGRGTTKLGKGSSSAKAEPQTSRSREEQ
ncbi:disease resistance protein RPV1-like isoform X2 [Syzygium oleosum]|nr:disease resistance protein RPV1-like isoform X2 [Syzygium oleosum]